MTHKMLKRYSLRKKMGQSSALGISYSFFSSFTDAGVLVPATAVARESAATVSLFLAMVADDDALVTALICAVAVPDTGTGRSFASCEWRYCG